MSFCDWLTSLTIMFSRVIHVLAWDKNFFPFCKVAWYSPEHLYSVFFIHSSTYNYLDSFHLFALISIIATDVNVQISVENLIKSFGYIPCRVVGLYDNAVFSFLRNLHTAFHRNCPILHSCQQCTRVPISLHRY